MMASPSAAISGSARPNSRPRVWVPPRTDCPIGCARARCKPRSAVARLLQSPLYSMSCVATNPIWPDSHSCRTSPNRRHAISRCAHRLTASRSARANGSSTAAAAAGSPVRKANRARANPACGIAPNLANAACARSVSPRSVASVASYKSLVSLRPCREVTSSSATNAAASRSAVKRQATCASASARSCGHAATAAR